MSQAQINSTQVLCRLLELDKPQISGQALHDHSKDGAQHLIRERMLVHGPSSQWINCPECGVELARIVRDVSVDDVLLQCPECDDVTAPKHYSHNHKVSFTKLVSNLATGLNLNSVGCKVIDHEQIWRLGVLQSGRSKPTTWYFARQLHKPSVAGRLREQIHLEKTAESSVVLTSSDLPLPKESPLFGFEVLNLGMAARISQSRFEFFDTKASSATQIMVDAKPETTLKYVESDSCVWIDGVKYMLEPRQRLILLALMNDLDHEMDKEALRIKCNSQAQDFMPRKEFDRNTVVYKKFIHYLRFDMRYQLQVPVGESYH
jgi:hypothetical protein